MTERLVIVAGLGRCGSSLMMQMLQAGGMRCAGEFPAFELSETNHQPIKAEWLEQFRGGAIKILDPHFCPIQGEIPAVMLWMQRDTHHQAKSQIKFAMMLSGREPVYDKRHLKRMEKALEQETEQAIRSYPYPMMPILFEDVLNNPFAMARKIIGFLGPFDLAHSLDARAMAFAVHPRGPECEEGLEMEMKLIQERP